MCLQEALKVFTVVKVTPCRRKLTKQDQTSHESQSPRPFVCFITHSQSHKNLKLHDKFIKKPKCNITEKKNAAKQKPLIQTTCKHVL